MRSRLERKCADPTVPVPYPEPVRRVGVLLLVATLLVLTACAREDVLVEFEGTITTVGLEVPVEFHFLTYGQALRGDYYVSGAKTRTGRAEGTIDGTDLTMTIYEERVPGCVFDFEGSINDEELVGIFEPREDQEIDCGTGGTWELTRIY